MSSSSSVTVHCPSCGAEVDVSAFSPFSTVDCPGCGTQMLVKDQFGPYRLLRLHAKGGMSLVFLAKDETLGREVALKILNENYSADERRILAFEHEAHVTASISHPNVVRLFTTGRAFDRYYLAMEFVPGGHLEQQIRERDALSESEVLPLAIQVAEGLQAAQAAGLIHRDIKPGNILLDGVGNAKIVDFGLALMTKGGKAQATEIWATSYYVPPETIDGKEEDFRSDIYAFGASLYHALAGVPPCVEESLETVKLREAKRNIKPLAEVAPWLMPETCAAIDRAMAYRPEDRTGSYEEMIATFRVALQKSREGPRHENAGSARRRYLRKLKRRKRLTIAGVGLLALAGVSTAIHFISRKPEPTAQPQEGTIAVNAPIDSIPDIPTEPPPPSVPLLTVGQRYKSAHGALEAQEFERAASEFAALRDDSSVQEPTRTWAGVEAVLAAYLGGDSRMGRTQAALSSAHAAAAGLDNPNVNEVLIPALDRIQELPCIPPEVQDPGTADGIMMISWMVQGLKNWEQGCLKEAVVFFDGVVAVKLAEQDLWALPYQGITNRYLADAAALDRVSFETLPPDKEASLAKLKEMEGLLPSLRTHGRARFNVREWELQVRRHIREIDLAERQSIIEQQTLAFSREELDRLAHEFLFKDALLKLDTLVPTEEEKPELASMRMMLTAANALMVDLQKDLKGEGVAATLHLREGNRTFTGIEIDPNGTLWMTTPAGEKETIAWKDLTADSMIELHRLMVRKAPEKEVLRRHGDALAFDWLAGNRERATAAAERLAGESPVFKKRWEEMVAGLK